jgi:hypothetical protein
VGNGWTPDDPVREALNGYLEDDEYRPVKQDRLPLPARSLLVEFHSPSGVDDHLGHGATS